MNNSIDTTFSVYHLVERLQQVSSIVNHRRTMSLISYEIENAVLIDGARPRMFSSFQTMSKFVRQQARYEEIARRSESVYVFGIPDVIPPAIENIHYIYLSPRHQLAKEWFVVAYSEGYHCTLATEELTQMTDPDHERQFRGIWTFNYNIASILNDWLTSVLDVPPYIEPDHAVSATNAIDMMRAGITRLNARLARPAASLPPARKPEIPQVQAETVAAVEVAVQGVM